MQESSSPRGKLSRLSRPSLPLLLAAVGANRQNGQEPATAVRGGVPQEQLSGLLARLRRDMAERFLLFQRESELRYLAWEQVSKCGSCYPYQGCGFDIFGLLQWLFKPKAEIKLNCLGKYSNYSLYCWFLKITFVLTFPNKK